MLPSSFQQIGQIIHRPVGPRDRQFWTQLTCSVYKYKSDWNFNIFFDFLVNSTNYLLMFDLWNKVLESFPESWSSLWVWLEWLFNKIIWKIKQVFSYLSQVLIYLLFSSPFLYPRIKTFPYRSSGEFGFPLESGVPLHCSDSFLSHHLCPSLFWNIKLKWDIF